MTNPFGFRMFFVKYSVGIKRLAVATALEGLPLTVINHQIKCCITEKSLDQWLALHQAPQHVVQDPATYQHGRPTRFTRIQIEVMYVIVYWYSLMFLDEVQDKVLI